MTLVALLIVVIFAAGGAGIAASADLDRGARVFGAVLLLGVAAVIGWVILP